MNEKLIIFLLLLTVLSGCQKQEIQLPLINSPGLSEIQNHSSIWIFRDSSEAGIVPRLNKNNKIINTHWIFNIDKRLSMHHVVPLLVEMQQNKNKPSMHKKGNLISYYSYADLSGKKISLIPFPETNFVTLDDDSISQEISSKEDDLLILELFEKSFILDNQIIARDSIMEILKRRRQPSSMENEESKQPILILKYSGETLYQDYLSMKAFLKENEIITSSTEYLMTVK